MSVTQDPTSSKYVPASSLEWAELLQGTGASVPNWAWWNMQETTGTTLVDASGNGRHFSLGGSGTGVGLGAALSGWSRTFVTLADSGGNFIVPAPQPNTTSFLGVFFVAVTATPAATRTVIEHPNGFVELTNTPRFQANAGSVVASTSAPGTTVHVIAIKHDVTNGVDRVYIDGTETLSPTYNNANSTGAISLGHSATGSSAGAPVAFTFGAAWSGSSAELSDSVINAMLLTFTNGPSQRQTLTAIQSNSAVLRFVACIDGYPHLLTDAPQAAVQAAWTGTDFATTTTIPNVMLDLDNRQQIDPWSTFNGGGKCTLRIQPDASDTLGIDTHRTNAGSETTLEQTIDRTQVFVASFPDSFDLNGEAHCGTECFSWDFIAGRGFSHSGLYKSKRGKYVAAGVQNSITQFGALRFAEAHNVVAQDDGVRLKPVISQHPRSWRGRRVSVWAHTWDESTQSLCVKSQALCIFVGTLTEIRDDASTGDTVILAEHELDRIKNAVIGRDTWKATLRYGHQLSEGMTFQFKDYNGTAYRTANNLVVVASGAADTNHINAGWYSIEEIASFINAWLAGERGAARIYGSYTLNTPEGTATQARTVMHFYIPGTGSVFWRITWPNTTWSKCLGFPTSQYWSNWDTASTAHAASSPNAPSPGTIFGWNQSASYTPLYAQIDTSSGTFQGQYSTLPSTIQSVLPANGGIYGNNWGVFVLDSDTPWMFVAAFQNGQLANVRGIDGASFVASLTYDQMVAPYGGNPPKVRQIFIHSAPVKTFLKWLFYSTGTSGYNHSTFDLLPTGTGLNIPYDYLGTNFETSCDLLPGANDQLTVTIDKPTKLSEVIGNDLLLRTSHLVWRSGGFMFMSWTTPSSVQATVTLGESSKAAPAGTKDSHITASVLDGSWVKNVIKINYNRSILSSGKSGDAIYNSAPISVEDATSIDDAGGSSSVLTLDLRNVYGDDAAISPGVRQLAKSFLAWLPWFSRPVWKVTRSLDLSHIEGFGVGDIVAVSDPFVRDPSTGGRGISLRPGLVISHGYQMSVPRPPDRMKLTAQVDIVFLNVDRTLAYSPCAEVNESASGAGYDGSVTLTLKSHEHSESTETVDVGRFATNDVVRIVEVDPADPAAPDSWVRTVASVSTAANTMTLTSSLSSPAFSAAKRYRVIPAGYTSTTTAQHSYSFQASGNTKSIQEIAQANLYGSTSSLPWLGVGKPTTIEHTRTPELPANVSYGPEAGAPRDSGYEKELSLLVDNLMDHKTALSSPMLTTLAKRRTAPNGTPELGRWYLLSIEQLYLGDMLNGTTSERYLWLGPRWRSVGSISTTWQLGLRVSICGYPPTGSSKSSVVYNATLAAPSQSLTWWTTTLNSTWQNWPAQAFKLSTFNKFQFVYIVVEGQDSADYMGLHTLRMTQRVEPEPLISYIQQLRDQLLSSPAATVSLT